MDKSIPEKSINNKHLILILSVLGAIIVALVIAIIVVNVNTPTKEEPTVTEEERELYWDDMSEEELEEAHFLEEWYSIKDQVGKLLEEENVDTETINKLYYDAIEKEISNKRLDHAYSYIIEWKNNLLSKDLKQEALDGLVKVNYEAFYAPDQYRLYKELIDLADSLGDSSTKQKYEALLAGVEAAYNEDSQITENALQTQPSPEEVMSNNIIIEESE